MEGKNKVILTGVLVAFLSIATIAATYAYFAAQIGAGATTNINVTSRTTDTVSFDPGEALTLIATQQNFGEGMGNLTSNATAKANLVANNVNEATYCYEVDLVISTNSFVYTTDPTNTPELTFSITKNGTGIVSELDVTTAGSETEYTYRIPTTSGGSDYKHVITAAAGETVTDTYVPSITFVNLEADQLANEGKAFAGALQLNKVDC